VYAASEDWGTGGDTRTDGLAARIARAAEELAGLVSSRPAAAGPTDPVIPFEQQLAALRLG
jgi:FMN reductase